MHSIRPRTQILEIHAFAKQLDRKIQELQRMQARRSLACCKL
jgi:hypothetical protein